MIETIMAGYYIDSHPILIRVCEFCGSEFRVPRVKFDVDGQVRYRWSDKIYCDLACKNSHVREMMEDLKFSIVSQTEVNELIEKIYQASRKRLKG